jgi:transposase-like protein
VGRRRRRGRQALAAILTEIKNRGVGDVLMLACDGLKGLPGAVETVWPRTVVQTCVVHLLRNSFRYAARQDWDKIARLLRPVYTAPTEEAALDRFAEFADARGRKYPAIVKLWENAWEEFTPFPRFDAEIRRIVCTTNAIESVNARIRRTVRARGHFPRRDRRPEVRLRGDHVPRSHGQGPGPLDHALEDRPERLRHHLRRPPVGGPSVTPATPVTPNV